MAKKRLFLFASTMCKDCEPAKEILEKNNIEYRVFDISEDLGSLKFFLKQRDTYDVFKELKENEKIGIPCLMVGNGEEFIFDFENTDFSRFAKQ